MSPPSTAEGPQSESQAMFADFDSQFSPPPNPSPSGLAPPPGAARSQAPVGTGAGVNITAKNKVSEYKRTKSKRDLFRVAAMRMTEEQRRRTMELVKAGRLSVEEAVQDVLSHDPSLAAQYRAELQGSRQEIQQQQQPRPPPSELPTAAPIVAALPPQQSADSLSDHFAGFDAAFGGEGGPASIPTSAESGGIATATNPFAQPNSASPTPLAAPSRPSRQAEGLVQIAFAPGQLGLRLAGAEVKSVVPDGQADASGVRIGWILVRVGGKPVATNEEIIQALKAKVQSRTPYRLSFRLPPKAASSSDDESENERSSSAEDGVDSPANALSQHNYLPQRDVEDGERATLIPRGPPGGPRVVPPAASSAARPAGPNTEQKTQWQRKLETISTLTREAVMRLREDSLAIDSRVQKLETARSADAAKGHGAAPVDAGYTKAQLKEMFTKLVHTTTDLRGQVASLRSENGALKQVLKRLVAEHQALAATVQQMHAAGAGQPRGPSIAVPAATGDKIPTPIRENPFTFDEAPVGAQSGAQVVSRQVPAPRAPIRVQALSENDTKAKSNPASAPAAVQNIFAGIPGGGDVAAPPSRPEVKTVFDVLGNAPV